MTTRGEGVLVIAACCGIRSILLHTTPHIVLRLVEKVLFQQVSMGERYRQVQMGERNRRYAGN
jgi:hypothetical protein